MRARREVTAANSTLTKKPFSATKIRISKKLQNNVTPSVSNGYLVGVSHADVSAFWVNTAAAYPTTCV